MNIFWLSWDVDECARFHGDKHVGKMILEGTQLLCNAYWWYGLEAPYKPTHMNHPCSVWVRMNLRHWVYLRQLVLALGREYRHRFGRSHRSALLAAKLPLPPIPRTKFIRPPLVVPEAYQWSSVPHSYRLYYLNDKKHLHVWTRRARPWWVEPIPDPKERLEPMVIHPEPWEVVPRDSVVIGKKPWVNYQGDPDRWVAKRMADPKLKADIRNGLRGHDLVCFCRLKRCPAELYLQIANSRN